MTVRNWNTAYGVWNVGTNWAGGVAPGSGDTAIIDFANAEPDFSAGGTLANIGISLVSGFKLDIAGSSGGPTVLDAASSIGFANGATFTIADAGIFVNNGHIGYAGGTGEVDWYLIPGGGVTSALMNNGTLDIGAPFKLLGFGDFWNNGLIQVRNVTGLPGVGLTVMSGTQSLLNNGTFSVDGHDATTRTDTSATLANVFGTGTINLAYGGITFKGDVGGNQTLRFLDGLGTANLDLLNHSFSGTIAGFQAGDVIDLGAITADGVQFIAGGAGNPGTLEILNAGTAVATLLMDGSYATGDFALAANGLDQVLSTTAAPCFATGTRLLTANGEVAVEALSVGDLVPTHLGRRLARIRWIGHRTLDCRRHARPQDVCPVRVVAGAFGPGAPRRDLVLSPDHAVHMAGEGGTGVLVPVRYLINGATIRQEPAGQITYWHVELDRHDVVLAEGLPVETYLDTGNRGAFANGDGAEQLHPDFARGMWEAAGCASLVTEGSTLVAARAALLRQAEELGYTRSTDAAPRLVVDGQPIQGAPAAKGLTFHLPPGACRAVLYSRTACPAEVEPASPDHRRLGVAVAALALDGTALAADDARLGTGWVPPEPRWRWTGGAAEIDVSGSRRLEVRLLPMLRYWVPVRDRGVRAPRAAGSASAAA